MSRPKFFTAALAALTALVVAAPAGATVIKNGNETLYVDYPEVVPAEDIKERVNGRVTDVRSIEAQVLDGGPRPDTKFERVVVEYTDVDTGEKHDVLLYRDTAGVLPEVGDREVVLLDSREGVKYPAGGINTRFKVKENGRLDALGDLPYAKALENAPVDKALGLTQAETAQSATKANGRGGRATEENVQYEGEPGAPANFWACDYNHFHGGFCHTSGETAFNNITIFAWFDSDGGRTSYLGSQFKAAADTWDMFSRTAIWVNHWTIAPTIVAQDGLWMENWAGLTRAHVPHGHTGAPQEIYFNLGHIGTNQAGDTITWNKTANGNRQVACHELGHALGLAHDNAQDGCMFWHLTPNNSLVPSASQYNVHNYLYAAVGH